MKFSMPCSDFSAPRLRYTSRMTARCMVLALLPIVPLAARAQSAPPDYAYVGAGVRTRPAYDGSAAQRTDLIPTVRYYGKPWFARTTQGILEGGARIELARGLNVGAQIAYEGGRLASESDFLRSNNVPDITPAPRSACTSNGTRSSVRCRSRCSRAGAASSTAIAGRKPTCASPRSF